MATTDLQLTLAGASVHFRCDHPELRAYARLHLGPLLSDGPARDADVVVARLRWHEAHPPQDAAAVYPQIRSYERLDRDLYAGGQEVIWLRVDDARDLHLRFEVNGSQLRVEGDFYHRLSQHPRADMARRILYRRQLGLWRRKRFTRLLYYLVYYPALWWMEHVSGAHPLHAGAVDTPNGAILLAGPSGVGKSTLTVALAGADGAKMLSDTFVLHHGTGLWAVPEPLLLDRWSRTWLGEAGAALVPIHEHRYAGRTGYTLPRERLVARAEAAVVVLPRRTPAPYVREVAGAEALVRIDAYNDIVNDLRRYRAVAAVLELIAPSGLARARLASLEQLTVSTPCYEVGLTAELSRADAVQTIMGLCHGSGRSHPRQPLSRHA